MLRLLEVFVFKQRKGVGMGNVKRLKSSPVAAPVTALEYIQKAFAMITFSGEVRYLDKKQLQDILSGSDAGPLDFYKWGDFQVLMRREIEVLPVDCNKKQVLADFRTSPKTDCFSGVAFSPVKQPSDIINWWVGATVKPCKGDWAVIESYLKEVICDNDQALYTDLKYRLAHMLQKPEEKPGIMVVLLGEQGTGKGVFFSLLRKIWSRTFLLVSDVDSVVGRFNAGLERNYVICLDEALFHGDKHSMERLKSLITEDTIVIEEKYSPSRSIDSYHRFFAASNNDQFGHIASDDRRFLFLRVSSSKKQDTNYFSTVVGAIKDDLVIGAMVDELMNVDLAAYNARQRPITTEHCSQRLQSLIGFDRYWFEVLFHEDVNFVGDRMYVRGPDFEKLFVETKDLIGNLERFEKSASRFNGIQARGVNAAIGKLCPSAIPKREHNKRGFQLPPIEVAREEFAKAIGVKVDWDTGEAIND